MNDQQTIIDRNRRSRVQFDPSDKAHLAELRFFMANGKWQNGCPFLLEHPYLEIPAMCYQRVTEHSLA
jgi:hypothetical protein